MQTNKNHSVSGQELDNLLKQAFLNLDLTNPKNDAIMETVANTTLTKPVSFMGSKTFITSLKWIFAVLSVLSVIFVASYFMTDHREEDHSVIKTLVPSGTAQMTQTQVPATQSVTMADDERPSAMTANKQENTVQVTNHSYAEPVPDPSREKLPVPFTNPETKKTKDSAYAFPVLTDEEIAANEKRKEKILVQAIKLSSAKYAFIPLGFVKSPYYTAKGATIQYIQKTEVSNIDYKTFLFDLLIHGNYDAFLKAKPDQSLWNTIYDKKLGSYFEDVYFSDKAYNNYPVVNVSREGAELYCKWLKEESQSLAEEKDILKEEDRDRLYERSYALPTATDWAYAAEGGEIGNAYPWTGPYMRNSKGAYLANFCIRKEKQQPGSTDMLNDYTSASVGSQQTKDLLICPVDGFKPNAFGLYNMSGNVGEFSLDDSTGHLLVKGGGWNSSPGELKISSKEPVKGNGASPDHGFRPMITLRFLSPFFSLHNIDSISKAYSNPLIHYPVKLYPFHYPALRDDSAYVFPILTEAEIQANHKQKKRMTEQLMKLQKDSYAYIPMGSFIYGKDTFSCRAFYMQTKEVSNLEYRTFLFDLLIAGRKEEFLKAKPDQEQWNNKFGMDGYLDSMRQLYFSHPAYDDYPMVNVSREGAEMYCIWLSIAVNKALREKGRPLMNDLRLPSDYEWAYAASNKANQARYANGTAYLRNSKGLYMQNYNCDTYANSRYDSIHDVYLFHKTEKGKGPVTDGGFFTTVTGAYTPNLYGIYDLAGNVSEMVYLWDGKSNRAAGFGTKGGSWCSPDYFLEIDAAQEFKHPEKPSPFVGFRPVMTGMTVGTMKK